MFEFNIRPETVTILQELGNIPQVHEYLSFSVPKHHDVCTEAHRRFESALDASGNKATFIADTTAFLDWLDTCHKGRPIKKRSLEEYMKLDHTRGVILGKLRVCVDNSIYQIVLERAFSTSFSIVELFLRVAHWYSYKKIETMNYKSSFALSTFNTKTGFLLEYLSYMEGYSPSSYGTSTKAWLGFCLKQLNDKGLDLLFTEVQYRAEKARIALEKKPKLEYNGTAVTLDDKEIYINEIEATPSLQKRVQKLDKELWEAYSTGGKAGALDLLRARI